MKVAPEERWGFHSGSLSSLLQVWAHSCFITFNCNLLSVDWRRSPGSTIWLPPSDDATQCNATQHSPALSPAAQPISEGKLLSSRADFLRKSYLREIFLSAAETSGLRCLIIYFGFLFYISSLCLSSLLSSTAPPPLDRLHRPPPPPPPPPPPRLKTSAPF